MAKKSKLHYIEEARNDTYYTSVVLDKGRKNDYQLVFASQVYGTFFGIYAKFDVTEKSDESIKLNKINFRIINYKGLINVGINKISYKYYSKADVKLNIQFHLKGLMPPVQNQLLDFSTENIILKSDDRIVTERKLDRFIGTKEEIFENGAFDDEFYFRDGLYPIEASKAALEKEIERQYPDSKRPLDWRCPRTIIRIVICKKCPS